MIVKKTDTIEVAAAKAGFKSGHGLPAGRRSAAAVPGEQATEPAAPGPAGRHLRLGRRADSRELSGHSPGRRVRGVDAPPSRAGPGGAANPGTADPRVARRARPRAGGDLPPEARAGPAGPVRLHPHGIARRDRRRSAARSHALSLPPRLVGLRPCPGRARRRELHGAGGRARRLGVGCGVPLRRERQPDLDVAPRSIGPRPRAKWSARSALHPRELLLRY